MKCCRRVGIEFSFLFSLNLISFGGWGKEVLSFLLEQIWYPVFLSFFVCILKLGLKDSKEKFCFWVWWFWCLWFWKLSAWIRVLVFSFLFILILGLVFALLRFGNPNFEILHIDLETQFEVLFEIDCTYIWQPNSKFCLKIAQQIWQSNSKFCLKIAHRFGNPIQSFVRDCAQIWRPNSKFCSRLHADLVTQFEVLLFLFEWNEMELNGICVVE